MMPDPLEIRSLQRDPRTRMLVRLLGISLMLLSWILSAGGSSLAAAQSSGSLNPPVRIATGSVDLEAPLVEFSGSDTSLDQETPHDPNDPEDFEQLIDAAFVATNAGDFATAERYWTQLIERMPDNPAVWSNRGNAKVSQNKLSEALVDYAKAIELAPNAPDPYLNRGAAWEGLGEWQAAIADYNRVLDLDPEDAYAYNNRGNAEAGLGQWDAALTDYQQAADLDPNFAFARANYALALYQTGQTDQSIRIMRNLVRRYPKFPDMRAALAAALWAKGRRGEAESNWVSVMGLDQRYEDLDWVKTVRRWPPVIVRDLDQFLKLKF